MALPRHEFGEGVYECSEGVSQGCSLCVSVTWCSTCFSDTSVVKTHGPSFSYWDCVLPFLFFYFPLEKNYKRTTIICAYISVIIPNLKSRKLELFKKGFKGCT